MTAGGGVPPEPPRPPELRSDEDLLCLPLDLRELLVEDETTTPDSALTSDGELRKLCWTSAAAASCSLARSRSFFSRSLCRPLFDPERSRLRSFSRVRSRFVGEEGEPFRGRFSRRRSNKGHSSGSSTEVRFLVVGTSVKALIWPMTEPRD